MKRNRLIVQLILLTQLLCSDILSQTFYYSDGQQIGIIENKTSVIIYFTGIQYNLSFSDSSQLVNETEYTADSLGIIFYLDDTWNSELGNFTEYLSLNSSIIEGASFGYSYDTGNLIFPSFQIVLVPSEEIEPGDLDSLKQLYNLTFVKEIGNMSVMHSDDPGATITIANELHENTLIEWCHPDFLVKATPDADPLYSFQYYLNNTGQTGGAVDADIDAPEAWTLSTGSNNIVVAVIDQGVENIHDDFFYEQTSLTKVLSGWGWDNNGGQPVTGSEKHGNRVAGIIAAEHNTVNNYGIKGICPQCKILPLRISLLQFTNSTDYANAFFQANLLGADVINCSWNLSAGPFNDVTNELYNTLYLGRNGLGVPIVFSAGNNGLSSPLYPSGLTDVITVSALDKNGSITTYSTFGSQIEVAAFGGDPADIYTTDLMGTGNVNGGGLGNNYFNIFSGTSAAAAQVSGVAALLLSMDPTLRWYQVACRIQEGATDIGGFGLDTYYGSGRLNAYYTIAVNNLDLIDPTISGLQSYSARHNITSGNGSTILTTANVTLTAGEMVDLNPGFDTEVHCVFTAIINNSGPCGTQSSGPFRYDTSTGTENPINSSLVKNVVNIYPNPSGENVFISLSKENNDVILEIDIYNNYHQHVTSIKCGRINLYTLELKSLPSGFYYVRVKTLNGTYTNRLIKI